MPLWERVGLLNECSPLGIYFTGEDEGEEINKELNGIFAPCNDRGLGLRSLSANDLLFCVKRGLLCKYKKAPQ
jgi:hypothetical protein